jgi:hypothetical protein
MELETSAVRHYRRPKEQPKLLFSVHCVNTPAGMPSIKPTGQQFSEAPSLFWSPGDCGSPAAAHPTSDRFTFSYGGLFLLAWQSSDILRPRFFVNLTQSKIYAPCFRCCRVRRNRTPASRRSAMEGGGGGAGPEQAHQKDRVPLGGRGEEAGAAGRPGELAKHPASLPSAHGPRYPPLPAQADRICRLQGPEPAPARSRHTQLCPCPPDSRGDSVTLTRRPVHPYHSAHCVGFFPCLFC